jgi:hypothetical protein
MVSVAKSVESITVSCLYVLRQYLWILTFPGYLVSLISHSAFIVAGALERWPPSGAPPMRPTPFEKRTIGVPLGPEKQ